MNILDFLRPKQARADEAPQDPDALDARRRSLRARLAKNQADLSRLWTDYRTRARTSDEKRDFKKKIKIVQDARKSLVKEMMRVESAMKSAK